MVLNSAVWGQCDSIYVSLALLALYWGMSGKPALGMAAMACSFAFKLQAVFIMPVFVLLLIAKRVKLWHFLIFPAVYMPLQPMSSYMTIMSQLNFAAVSNIIKICRLPPTVFIII